LNSQKARLIGFVQNSSFIAAPSTVVYREASLHPPKHPLTPAIKRGSVFNCSVFSFRSYMSCSVHRYWNVMNI